MQGYLDPAQDESNPVAPQDSQSTDSSQPGLRKAWDAWTSRPENNAALLQFGIAMLQPRAPGQSGIGSVANAVGEAAGASQRNIAEQRAVEEADSKRSQEEAKTEATTSNAASTRITANAYKDQVASGPTGGKQAISGLLRQQADFRKWLAKPEDNTGLSVDPIVGALSKQFPDVKTKADLVNNPRALAAAQKLFSAQFTTEPTDDGTLVPTAAQPGQPGAAAPQTKMFFNNQTGQQEPFVLQGGQWIPAPQ